MAINILSEDGDEEETAHLVEEASGESSRRQDGRGGERLLDEDSLLLLAHGRAWFEEATSRWKAFLLGAWARKRWLSRRRTNRPTRFACEIAPYARTFVLSRMNAMTSQEARQTHETLATEATTLAARRARSAIVDGGATRFVEVVALIEAARQSVYNAVNSELVAHYWEIGE